MIGVLTRGFVAAALAVCLSQGVAESQQGNVDQSWEGTPAVPFRSWGSVAIRDGNLPLAQEFIPTAGDIVGTEVCLRVYGSGGSITAIIREGAIDGDSVTSVTRLVEDISSGWVYFDFPDTDILPGTTYLIELSGETTIGWDFTDVGNGYTPGRAIMHGTARQDDFLFRTYTSAGPVITPNNPCVPLESMTISPTSSASPTPAASPSVLPSTGGRTSHNEIPSRLLSPIAAVLIAAAGYAFSRARL